MSTPLRITASLCSLFLVSGCATSFSRMHSDVVPPESLHVAQVYDVGTRAQLVKPNSWAYKAVLAAGIADSDLVDGSIVMARIYCCGGRAEYENSLMMYVPKPIKLELGDFVEFTVGRSPENNDGGRLNTVTRVVAKERDKPESCWWDPRTEGLRLRVAYCDWMSKEGWVKQGGISPAWYKPAR